ncbi:MAG: adenylyltransferase/cytidyltransferase family protein [Litoreibacter sp.]
MSNCIKQDVGILGGSFDPPHEGHAALIRSAFGTGNIGAVWVVPALSHRGGKSLSAYGHRIKMCEIMAASIDHDVRVLRTESEVNIRGLSARLVSHFSRTHPDQAFRFLVGDDVAAFMARWPDMDVIEQLAPPLIFPRIQKLDGLELSSTQARHRLSSSDFTKGLLLDAVRQYAVKHLLYSDRS